MNLIPKINIIRDECYHIRKKKIGLANCFIGEFKKCVNCYGGPLNFINKLIKFRGGEIINITGNKTTNIEVLVDCKHNHKLNKFTYDMIYKGKWCVECSNFANNINSNICKHKLKKLAECFDNTINKCAKCYGGSKNYISLLVNYRNGKVINIDGTNNHNLKVTIKCENNHPEFTYSYDSICNGKWCKECNIPVFKRKKVRNITYDVFIERINDKTDPNYNRIYKYCDYSLIVKDDIINGDSKIKIKCILCENIWDTTTVNSHLCGKSCPECAGNIKLTKERFINRIYNKNDPNYEKYRECDYSLIEDYHFNYGQKGEIPIIHIPCMKIWTPSIGSHINSTSSCPYCYGNIPYTYEILMETVNDNSHQFYESKFKFFDYNLITKDHILNGAYSKIPLIHLTCNKLCEPTINTYINTISSCIHCYGNTPWSYKTYDKLIDKLQNMSNKNEYDYSLVKAEHLNNGHESKIPVIHISCGDIIYPSIDNQLKGQSNCAKCSKKVQWSYEKLMKLVNDPHDDNYKIKYNECDHSLIKSIDIKNSLSRIPIKHKLCQLIWYPTIHQYANSQSSCPHCNQSKLEKIAFHTIQSIILDYSTYNIKLEYREQEKNIHGQKYDGSLYISYNKITYILRLEYDGEQHFDSDNYYNIKNKGFDYQRKRDILKEQHIFDNNESLIRVNKIEDNNNIKYLELFLHKTIPFIIHGYQVLINIKNDIMINNKNCNVSDLEYDNLYSINMFKDKSLIGIYPINTYLYS